MNGREKTRHDVYEYRPDQYNKGSPASASVDRKSFFLFLFSRNILQRMGATLCCSVVRNRLATLPIRLSSLQRGSVWKIDNALWSPITLPILSPSRRRQSAKENARLTEKRPEKENPRTLRQVGQHHQITAHIQRSTPRSAPQVAEASPTEVSYGSMKEIPSHLHLIKIGHRPLVIPTILL